MNLLFRFAAFGVFAAPPNFFILTAIVSECGSELVRFLPLWEFPSTFRKIVGLIHELTLHIFDLILSLKLVSFPLIKLAKKLKAFSVLFGVSFGCLLFPLIKLAKKLKDTGPIRTPYARVGKCFH